MTALERRRAIDSLRTRIYDVVGYMGGASDMTVAMLGIRWGGKAAAAGHLIIAMLNGHGARSDQS